MFYERVECLKSEGEGRLMTMAMQGHAVILNKQIPLYDIQLCSSNLKTCSSCHPSALGFGWEMLGLCLLQASFHLHLVSGRSLGTLLLDSSFSVNTVYNRRFQNSMKDLQNIEFIVIEEIGSSSILNDLLSQGPKLHTRKQLCLAWQPCCSQLIIEY